MPTLSIILLLVASVVALVVGPIILMLYLGSTSGMLIALAFIAFGAIGLWIGMRALEARRREEGPDIE